MHRRRERRTRRVLLATATGRGVRGRERTGVTPDSRGRRAGGGDVHAVVLHEDPARGGEADIELAVPDLGPVERREPHDELPVAVPARLVADVRREHASVAQEAAAVVLGVVRRALVRRGQLADLLRLQVADALALELEDAPALGRVRLPGVLTGDEPLGVAALRAGEEADLRVDVEALGVVGARRDHSLLPERRHAVVRVEVVALTAEHDRPQLAFLPSASPRSAPSRPASASATPVTISGGDRDHGDERSAHQCLTF